MPINIMTWGIYIVSVSPLFFKYFKLNSEFVETLSRTRDHRHATSLPLIFFIQIIFLFAISACDNAGDPIVPEPGDVQMVAHSAADDTLANERGIDAVPVSDGIHLAWYSLNDRNITNYHIYRQKEDGSFFQKIKTIDLETASPGKDTTFVDDNAEAGLELNSYYYYFVTASNTEGKESSAIDTLRYMLIDKPTLLRSDKETYDQTVDGLPVFFWNFIDIPDSYILRIENSFDQLHFIHIFQVIDYFNDQTLDLNDAERVPEFPQFTPGIYKWRIDSIGPDEDHSGAESNWEVFVII
jgi:hypothetical protein